jgi:hypothetical protein
MEPDEMQFGIFSRDDTPAFDSLLMQRVDISPGFSSDEPEMVVKVVQYRGFEVTRQMFTDVIWEKIHRGFSRDICDVSIFGV